MATVGSGIAFVETALGFRKMPFGTLFASKFCTCTTQKNANSVHIATRFHPRCQTCSGEILKQRLQTKWLTDITEFKITASRIYLSPIIDCYWRNARELDHCCLPLYRTRQYNAVQCSRDSQWQGETDYSFRSRRSLPLDGMDYDQQKTSLTRIMPKNGCSPDNSACEGRFGRFKNEMFYNRD